MRWYQLLAAVVLGAFVWMVVLTGIDRRFAGRTARAARPDDAAIGVSSPDADSVSPGDELRLPGRGQPAR
jgi:hypothetical protein